MKIKSKILIITIICFMICNISYNVFAFEFKTIEIKGNEIKKIENTNTEQEISTEENINRIARFGLKYQESVIEKKERGQTSKTYVNRDGYNYIYSRVNGNNFIEIKRYCYETGEYKTVFDNWGIIDIKYVRGHYVLDKVIYTAIYSTTSYENLRIVGYDTQTETITYDQTFPISYDTYCSEFCVDNNKNMYFVTKTENKTELSIVTYDKNGNFLDNITKTFLDGYYTSMVLTGVDNGGRVLFFSLEATNGYSWWSDDFVVRTNNGKFVNNKDVYLVRQYAGVTWRFLNDSQTHAYNQFGEFFEINYNADNEAGLSYKLVESIDFGGNYTYMSDMTSSDDTYAYIGTEQGNLYIFNWKTYKIEKSLSIGENKSIIGVHKTTSDKILIEYYNEADQKYYALTLTISDYDTPQENIELTDHTSLTHTKEQIENKYKELSIVNTTSDLYEVKPSATAPYVAGSLKTQVKTDTLNQINYFRWIAGLEDIITINNEYMESSQKGAVVLAANSLITGNPSYLSHYPSKPSDMADDFFTPGYKATSAGFGTSANISFGSLMAESVKGYVDDTANIEPNVGHRLSILDSKAVSTSFGFAERHGVINIFSDRTKMDIDNYYSWPSPGYFPAESMDANAMWSISVSSSDTYNISSMPNIVIKANGKEYSSDNDDFTVYLERYYNAYYFDIPKEVKEYLTDGANIIQDSKKVEVEFYGLSDNLGNTYVIKYPINFFSLNKKDILIGDVNNDGKISLLDCTKILAHVKRTQELKDHELLAADVNRDGKISLLDYTKVLAHVKRTALLF